MTNTGYLLSYMKYGDNDAILHFFTREEGFRSYFMRGIYSAKNKKKAYLAPLNEMSFVVNEHYKTGITNISKIEQVRSLDSNDVRTSSVVFFIAEFLHQVLKSEVKQTEIYKSISEFLLQLNSRNFQVHFVFLLKFLKIQGIAPLMGNEKYLNPESGEFEREICHQFFNEEISHQWKNFISEENMYEVKVKNALKEDFLDSILLYYYCHFPEFKTPKSLDILKQIFAD